MYISRVYPCIVFPFVRVCIHVFPFVHVYAFIVRFYIKFACAYMRGRCCHDRMVFRFITTYAISAYPTFNNVSAISWWRVLMVEETGVPG
jgi:hypothetical protein